MPTHNKHSMYGSYYNFKYNSEFGKFLHLLSHLILSHCHMILTLLEGGKKIYLPKFTTSKFYELCFLSFWVLISRWISWGCFLFHQIGFLIYLFCSLILCFNLSIFFPIIIINTILPHLKLLLLHDHDWFSFKYAMSYWHLKIFSRFLLQT